MYLREKTVTLPRNMKYTFKKNKSDLEFIVIEVYIDATIYIYTGGYFTVDEIRECLSQVEELKGENI